MSVKWNAHDIRRQNDEGRKTHGTFHVLEMTATIYSPNTKIFCRVCRPNRRRVYCNCSTKRTSPDVRRSITPAERDTSGAWRTSSGWALASISRIITMRVRYISPRGKSISQLYIWKGMFSWLDWFSCKNCFLFMTVLLYDSGSFMLIYIRSILTFLNF